MTTAVSRWAEQLAAWRIPDEILQAAPEPPHGFDTDRFVRRALRARNEDTPSRRHATEVLNEDGVVLDVGSGAGAASLALVPPAGHLIAVDESREMLRAFGDAAADLEVRHNEFLGRWPDVAGEVPTADVAVSHHVAYNVPDLDVFLRRLTEHARRRVVVELPTEHPVAWMTPYWEELHGLTRPDGPTVDDAVAVLHELGYRPNVQRWEQRPSIANEPLDEIVPFVRRKLCLPPDRDDEVRAVLERTPPPEKRAVVTIWWDGTALSTKR